MVNGTSMVSVVKEPLTIFIYCFNRYIHNERLVVPGHMFID